MIVNFFILNSIKQNRWFLLLVYKGLLKDYKELEKKDAEQKLYESFLFKLRERITDLFDSGAILFISNIDQEVGDSLKLLFFLFTFVEKVPGKSGGKKIQKVLKDKDLEEIVANLDKIGIPKMIKEYIKAMNKKPLFLWIFKKELNLIIEFKRHTEFLLL